MRGFLLLATVLRLSVQNRPNTPDAVRDWYATGTRYPPFVPARGVLLAGRDFLHLATSARCEKSCRRDTAKPVLCRVNYSRHLPRLSIHRDDVSDSRLKLMPVRTFRN